MTAIDASKAFAISNAPGMARIRRTVALGVSWGTVYENTDPDAGT